MAAESRLTVIVALAANLAVTAVKFVAALLTGSAAMYSEAAHSVADTLDEGFLLTSLERSDREPDARHPFGYGMERFFWSLLAALGILVAGAGFSAIEAYRAFSKPEHAGAHYFLVAYVAFAVALVADGASWIRSLRQLRAEATKTGRSLLEHVRRSHDPSVKTVAGEDTAAVIGILFAVGGVVMHQVTGQSWWEGVSASLICALLLTVGLLLARDVKAQLIGEATTPEFRQKLCDFLAAHPAVDEVVDVLTMQIGVNKLLVAARVDLAPQLRSDQVESASTEIEESLREQWPQVANVFLDATRASERVRRVGVPRR